MAVRDTRTRPTGPDPFGAHGWIRRLGRWPALVVLLLILATSCSSNAESDDDALADGDGVDQGQSDGASIGGGSEIAIAVGPIFSETGEGLSGAELETYLARRYEAYWQAFDRARENPSPDALADYPELSQLAAGEELEAAHQELGELFEAGEAIREPDSPAVSGLDTNSAHRIRVETLDVGVAELVSCLVNDHVRFLVEGGEIQSDGVVTVETRSTMAQADGTWKLIRTQAVALEPGVAGCWLEDESSYPL